MFTRREKMSLSTVVVAVLAALAGTTYAANDATAKTPLPPAVAGAIQKRFPSAAIDKVTAEEALGLKMYEVEIKMGKIEKTVTASEDGVISEVETEMPAGDLPAPAAEAVKKAAPGAIIKEVDKDQTLAEPTLVRLAAPKVTYEITVTREGKVAEVVMAADGTVLEVPQWHDAKNGHKDSDEGKKADKTALTHKAEKAIKKAFPKATIERVKAEEDEGVTLYEAVIREDAAEKEVEVSADGMIVNVETLLAAKDLPAVVADAIAKTAAGAQVQKAEKVETHAAARLVMLNAPEVSYEVELAANTQKGTIEVAADGTVIEPLKWKSDKAGDEKDGD